MSKYFDTKPGSLEENPYPLLNRKGLLQSPSPKRRKVRNQKIKRMKITSSMLLRWQRKMVKRLLQSVKNTK